MYVLVFIIIIIIITIVIIIANKSLIEHDQRLNTGVKERKFIYDSKILT